jgi:hypothetical protein
MLFQAITFPIIYSNNRKQLDRCSCCGFAILPSNLFVPLMSVVHQLLCILGTKKCIKSYSCPQELTDWWLRLLPASQLNAIIYFQQVIQSIRKKKKSSTYLVMDEPMIENALHVPAKPFQATIFGPNIGAVG